MNGLDLRIGDCLESLRAMPDASAQTCVTSPPYFGLRDYGHEGQIGLEETPDAYVAKLVEVFREVRRVLRDDGTLWLNLGDSYAANRGYQVPDSKHCDVGNTRGMRAEEIGLKPKDLIGIPWRVAFALQADGWYLRQDIIWHKPNPMPESVRDRCTKAHEYVFLLTKSPRYYYDQQAIAEPAAVVGGRACGSKNDASRNDHDTTGTVRGNGETRNRRSVWNIATQPFDGAHFATMPPGLAEPCILAGCPKGGTVLDPFGGAGTTGLVAARHGRHAILCELNPEYAQLAGQRISDEWREPVRDDAAPDFGPLFSGAAE